MTTYFKDRPFLTSLFKILIVSILVPIVTAIYKDYREKKNKKNEIINEIFESNKLVNANLNEVLTYLEIFVKTASNNHEIYSKEDLKKANSETTKLYLKFNRNAWNWQTNIFQRIKVLNIKDFDIHFIRSKFDSYTKSLQDRTKIVGNIWDTCLEVGDNYSAKEQKCNMLRSQFDSIQKQANIEIFNLAERLKQS